MDTQQCCGSTWPEQTAVDAWLSFYKINVTHRQAMELKEAVTAPRLTVQKELERTKRQMLPWWKKDKRGWPITTFKDKPVKSTLRIVLQNIRKLGL